MTVTIYHNPACGTSRNVLELIRHVGVEPTVVDYLEAGWSRALLVDLLARMGETAGLKAPMRPREILREKGTPAAELGLLDPEVADTDVIAAMVDHPVLVNRPIVVTPAGVKLCRPSEVVLDLLPDTGLKPFTKEDGEVVIDADGRRVR